MEKMSYESKAVVNAIEAVGVQNGHLLLAALRAGWLNTGEAAALEPLARAVADELGTKVPEHRRKLPTIGYDVQVISELAKKLYRSINDRPVTALRETFRGRYFEVKLDQGRIARVTVELDRVDPDA